MYNKEHKARKDYTCSKCGQAIQKGGNYVQVGLIPKNKNYHVDCQPIPKPVSEPKNEVMTTSAPEPETEVKSEVQTTETIETTSNPKPVEIKVLNVQRPRDTHGHFVRVYKELTKEGK